MGDEEHLEENGRYDPSLFSKDDPQVLGNWRNHKVKRTYPADFQRIEQEAKSDQDFQILAKISVPAEIAGKYYQKGLSDGEKRHIVDISIKHAGLTINERGVVELTLDNHYPIEIEVKLKMKHSTVYYYMNRAVKKLKDYIFGHWNMNELLEQRRNGCCEKSEKESYAIFKNSV